MSGFSMYYFNFYIISIMMLGPSTNITWQILSNPPSLPSILSNISFKVKESILFVKNFSKNKGESKMENSTQTFGEVMNLVLQPI